MSKHASNKISMPFGSQFGSNMKSKYERPLQKHVQYMSDISFNIVQLLYINSVYI